ncbi:hypothetical protein LVD15_07795 [Fulvivirga maritima]|uniref:hypothetical protein n=1 Tax=Fulvivirga maritima TaxID=2904247 RepID=UPI001F356273|nr:hypothetical protein [Fulvivirga maritima]UII28320.1 hypothetical protein LVD15_07795 [Fulvivirga maritima]
MGGTTDLGLIYSSTIRMWLKRSFEQLGDDELADIYIIAFQFSNELTTIADLDFTVSYNTNSYLKMRLEEEGFTQQEIDQEPQTWKEVEFLQSDCQKLLRHWYNDLQNEMSDDTEVLEYMKTRINHTIDHLAEAHFFKQMIKQTVSIKRIN